MGSDKKDVELSEVDQQIIDLLAKRIRLSSAAADEVFCPVAFAKEVEFLSSIARVGALGELVPKEVIRILATTIAGATATVHSGQTTVAYLGPPLSYSYLATVRYFSESAKLVPVSTISAVFEDVIAGRTDFGVVPSRIRPMDA